MSVDLVIRNGLVVDGSGGAAVHADVAVEGGRIVAVEPGCSRGRREIDADGAMVTPGWVDIHTHYDGQVAWDRSLSPSSWHGVTSVVMGNCGVGFAPLAPGRADWLINVIEGVEDIPGSVLHDGLAWNWESFPDYLQAISLERAIDFAAQVPHAALRGYVMGDRGSDHTERPTEEEIARMGELAAQAILSGALGFSTSRTHIHKSADGKHTPTYTATADELVGIARAIGRTGKGVLQVISDFVDFDAEFGLLREMLAASRRPMSVTTVQRPHYDFRQLLRAFEDATAEGYVIRGQVAPRPVGVLLSLESTRNPLQLAPTYQALERLDPAERIRRLTSATTRAAILQELRLLGAESDAERAKYAFVFSDPVRYDYAPSESLRARSERSGIPIDELVYDALVADGGRGLVYVAVGNYGDGDLWALREMMAHPLTVPGLGDGGAHCTAICDVSFPTYLLSYWGRDVADDLRFQVPWLVRQQTADTAATVGLLDRGLLKPGYKADLNVIDMDRLAVGRPEMCHDLPGGGKRLIQRAVGYIATVVSGEVIQQGGDMTGVTPGRLIRGPKHAPDS